MNRIEKLMNRIEVCSFIRLLLVRSSCIRIVQYNREDYTRVSSDRAKNGHVTIGKRLARWPPLLKILAAKSRNAHLNVPTPS
jgi:hypothetical protein